jgi:hypothetical protein
LSSSVAGIFKETATIFVGTIIFHDELTPINITGLSVALLGIALYNYLRYRDFNRSAKEESKIVFATSDYVEVDARSDHDRLEGREGEGNDEFVGGAGGGAGQRSVQSVFGAGGTFAFLLTDEFV